MFNEPDQNPEERVIDPKQRATEKASELRMHAEIAAVFEGPRKFGAELRFELDYSLAREIQKRMAMLEKQKSPESPVLPPQSAAEASDLLNLAKTRDLATNDYYVCRRPGELMILRWLAGDEVEAFYERMQAHFEAGLEGFREDERQSQSWKQDPRTVAFLRAMEEMKVSTAERYLREPIRKHKLFVLSTVTADEMDILHLTENVMGVAAGELVGEAAAPPEEPTERDRAWFFKLFSLRGTVEGQERMCFFTYLQKAEDTFELEA